MFPQLGLLGKQFVLTRRVWLRIFANTGWGIQTPSGFYSMMRQAFAVWAYMAVIVAAK
jgi:hypothetical protein